MKTTAHFKPVTFALALSAFVSTVAFAQPTSVESIQSDPNEFGVWQDTNSNGATDESEVLSQAEWGVMSIMLESDGVLREPIDGETESGHGFAVMDDGSTMMLADAAFTYTALPTGGDVELMAVDAPSATVDAEALESDENVLTIDMVLPAADLSNPLDLFADDNSATVQSASDYQDIAQPLATNQTLVDTLLQEEAMQY